MGTGTTEQTHRAPASAVLLHALWATRSRYCPENPPKTRGTAPYVDAARSSPLAFCNVVPPIQPSWCAPPTVAPSRRAHGCHALSTSWSAGVVFPFGVTTSEPLEELGDLPRRMPRSQPLGTRRFPKQKLLEDEIWNFPSPSSLLLWYYQARYEVTIQMHEVCRPRRLDRQEAQSGLCLAPFGPYIYFLPAQRLHFPPRSSRITIAQAASEARGGMSRKVVRSSPSMFICGVHAVRPGCGGAGRDKALCGSEIYSWPPNHH